MIDYYKAIDTETGQEVTYLREVSNRISPEMSAQDCFVALSFLREELEELWTNGTLDKEGERLRSELYTIRSIFFSDHEKLQYDRKLRQAQRKALEVEKVTTTDASNLSAKKEIPFEPVAVTQTKESPLKNYLFAAFAFVILLSLILFFNINVIVLIIGAILIVALMLLMSYEILMETNQLTFEHICFKYKGNDNQLFTDLDVTMETGQVVGILGASGSGKTTLTEILLGQLKPTCQQFRILENGKPVTAGSRSWSYVPQQNLLREYLKVSETFDFYADHHLKGGGKLTKKHRIAGIMDDLGLTEFANKKISELSGGQKRRVSIGIELLSPSPYFILDEPSSGLDALSDRNLLRTLKILAKSANKSIVVITHNTENLAIFDKIIFLSKGRPTFAGTYEELLLEYKTSDPYMIRKYMDMNIADVYQELNASTRIYKI